ncbi:uncharacterized protein HMPREF1541_00150 [Cyphellophora europaea CBS 101466]|uniref:HD domain-containing protein n=1 Tax=Cyphellophora europaea (strain CBS 101466) TaxID=1220924 RepID=W2SD73_CYPE1|nr:uncharacterized protein HMPREF1541_00150 [Cyphellophora europaea CBS 101466]ETN45968.1 hypothetical protein HMPREF1541_00150 [Cyphellophora europaea CBS 101466]
MTTLPTRTVANVCIPDTPLISAAAAFAQKHNSPATYNHVQRSLLLGFIIADQLFPSRDREAHAVAALLHDLGFPLGHSFSSTIISKDKRFEVDGANAAREFLRREGKAGEWDRHRVQLVWDAIALHTIGSIVFEKEEEVRSCAYGIWADFQGPDRVVGGLLSWEAYGAVVKDNMCHLCVTKPDTTIDNTVGEWGEKFVEGYSRVGKRASDMLQTCDLDDIELK